MAQYFTVTAEMKKFLTACCCICILISCSKKTVPSKANTVLESNNNINSNKNIAVKTDTVTVITMPADSVTVAASNIMVVADGYGKLITPQENLPGNINIQYNSLQLSKGFTVQQRANLQARYNIIPPRVLYVPDKLGSTSLKGSYYIYKKKFWYWKKADGLYYLDQKYYL